MAVERWGDRTVLVLESQGPAVDGRAFRDLLADAFSAGATLAVIPMERLEPAFFDLRSGVAGDLLQVSVTYRLPVAIVGDLPEPAASSRAFASLVAESNAGRQHWFLASVAAARLRVEGTSRR
jgi:hypothetical protein